MGFGDIIRFINDPKYSDQKISEMKKVVTDTGVYQDYIRPAAESVYEFVRTDNLRGGYTDSTMRNPNMPTEPAAKRKYMDDMYRMGVEYPMLNEKGVAYMKAGPSRLTDEEIAERLKIMGASKQ
jgi:hypothetical protein